MIYNMHTCVHIPTVLICPVCKLKKVTFVKKQASLFRTEQCREGRNCSKHRQHQVGSPCHLQ